MSAVLRSVTTLKSSSSEYCRTISRAGTSSPRASRNRKPLFSSASALSTRPAQCRYNPVLGEFFRYRCDYPNDTQGFFIAEQDGNLPRTQNVHISRLISPVSSIIGELRPKSKFPQQLRLDNDGGREPHNACSWGVRKMVVRSPTRTDALIFLKFSRRIRDHDAQHVCAWDPLWERWSSRSATPAQHTTTRRTCTQTSSSRPRLL